MASKTLTHFWKKKYQELFAYDLVIQTHKKSCISIAAQWINCFLSLILIQVSIFFNRLAKLLLFWNRQCNELFMRFKCNFFLISSRNHRSWTIVRIMFGYYRKKNSTQYKTLRMRTLNAENLARKNVYDQNRDLVTHM